ncbi:hypothetical protein [Streptomyces sp. NPDC050287]|uniref:hypothetical protein n=1 Tax=Streptomyces sp. NPDC050287 TaxID=3365608 RepID=UPI0037A80ED5
MIEIAVMFGLLAGACLGLIFVLLRRRSSPTENADGLLVEQARRVRAHEERTSYSARALDGTSPTMSDHYRP